MFDPPIAIRFSNGSIEAAYNWSRYELSDGDLILISPGGGRIAYRPGEWEAVGTLEDSDGTPWFAIEATA